MADKAWKRLERKVATWFGTRRNPLSGRNNVDDNGNPRPGDIIIKDMLVEVKQRKTNTSIERGKWTRNIALKLKPYFKDILIVDLTCRTEIAVSTRARDTNSEAIKCNLPWIHIEGLKNNGTIMTVSAPTEVIEQMVVYYYSTLINEKEPSG